MTVGQLRPRVRTALDAARDAALAHPRHLAVVTVAAGLAAGALVGWGTAVLVAAGLATITARATRRPGLAALLAICLLSGLAWGGWRTASLERTALGPLIGHAVNEEVTLTAPPRQDQLGRWSARGAFRGEPVLLRYPRWGSGAIAGDTGALLRVEGRLRPPGLAARAFHAHAELQAATVRDSGRRRAGPSGLVDGVRRRAIAALDQRLPPAERGLLRGMVLGQDEALPEDVRDDFRVSGLSHLVAASGSNIALLAALALGVSTLLGLGVRTRWVATLALIALYVPLAGAGPSIQRAGIMGAATIVAALAGRPALRWYVLGLAAVLTLAIDPRSAGQVGWQLSFAAVAGIAVLGARLDKLLRDRGAPAAVSGTLAITAAATIATAPVIALTFGRTSVVSLAANAIAAAAVAPVMWLGFVAATAGQLSAAVAMPITWMAGVPTAFIVRVADACASVPHAEMELPALAVVLCCALGAAALLLAPGPRRRIALGVGVAVLAVFTLRAIAGARGLAPPPPGTLRVLAVDVGQGDATLVQAGGHAVLFDAGSPGTGVVGGLRRAGVRRLDAVVATHGSSDHIGGVAAVLAALDVGIVLDGRDGDRSPVPATVDAAAHREGVPMTTILRGDSLTLGPMTIRVLWPPPATAADAGGDPNDRAVVAEVTASGARALLTADAESNVLAQLELRTVDVLKVSHHGSRDEGLPQTLERLRPSAAMIELGAHNTYGHPAPSTLEALRVVPQLVRTDRNGTAGFDVSAGGAQVRRVAAP